MRLKANVYIDGFNLYYGCLKGTSHKWLDINALCEKLLPNNEINRIRYFTASVHPRPEDPGLNQRQQLYLRALGTLPKVKITMGHFLSSKVWMMKADLSGKVKVRKYEEKGSDVNLASHILTDAYDSEYDVAVIVSNDSDLAYPMEYVKGKLGKIVGILNPHESPSAKLKSIANFYKPIREGVLKSCQFPSKLRDRKGEFHCPQDWISTSNP